MKIPKIIHQTWKNANLPKEFQKYVASWRVLHPDWKYILWTDKMNRSFIEERFPWFLNQYDRYPQNIQRADVIRYFILYEIGGVYIDLDFECLKPIDELIHGETCILGLEPELHCRFNQKEKIVCNAWIASAPKHEFLREIIFNLKKYLSQSVLDSTGPYMITEIYNTTQIDDVKILPSKYLYPLTMGDNTFRLFGLLNELTDLMFQDAYAVHIYSGTWKKTYLPSVMVSKEYLEKILDPLNISINDEDYEICERISFGIGFRDLSSLKLAEKWLDKIYFSNNNKKIYSEATLSKIIAIFWFFACFHSRHLGIGLWKVFCQSPLNILGKIPVNLKLKLAFCFLIHSCLHNNLIARSAIIYWCLTKLQILTKLRTQIEKPK